MLIAGFDTETTGLDVERDSIIQIGAVLWDTQATTKKAKLKLDALINHVSLGEIDANASAVNGITTEDLNKYGIPFENAYSDLHFIFDKADYIMAHNGNLFDRPIYISNCRRLGIEPSSTPWIDTTCDIAFPPTITTRKLVYLATEHGFLNPFPHDALSDVLTMLKIADQYDWDTTVKYSRAPTLTVKANVTFQQKELAKKQNYRWDNEKKIWLKSIKDFQLEETKGLALLAGFKVEVIKEGEKHDK